MRIGFAGDRDIAVSILKFIIEQGIKPLVLIVSSTKRASHAEELKKICGLSSEYIMEGSQFKKKQNRTLLKNLNLDYLICIHFPYIIPKEIIEIPLFGCINLHPAYLPYNRGWNTPSWAIIDQSPIGGTLHFMSEELDEGDIIGQKQIAINPEDTANTLYARIKECEIKLFKEQWQYLCKNKIQRIPQNKLIGSKHRKEDLCQKDVQCIHLDKEYKAEHLINKMRALTTSSMQESSYFIKDGKKYRVQINIIPDIK